MSSRALERFEETLSSLPVTSTRTTADEFGSTIDDVVGAPAVGVEPPFEGATLAGTDVTLDPTPAELREARTGVTAAGPAIAEYGSVVIQSGPEGVSLYPGRHVAVVAASDVVGTMADAIPLLGTSIRDGTTSAVVATGPSATADMGELVLGAHGPRDVHVVVLEGE
ncbi:lactate utilization protein C [Halobacteriales archaeon QS_8_69_26]|nr:MAG: lactate utilization protein C [Halobacteriales archaeon QS_8_69_26]